MIVDGTQDISGTEQESICIRYVDDALTVHEEFVGFYEPRSTTGADLAAMIEDALLRLGLPLSHLRGMTFHGASNVRRLQRGAGDIALETARCIIRSLWGALRESGCKGEL